MILAAYTADQHEWLGVNRKKPQVIELSEILRRAKFHTERGRPLNFRSASSVSYKINNLRAAHPGVKGKGLRSTKKEREVVDAFLAHRGLFVEVARAILKSINKGDEYVGMLGALMLNGLSESQVPGAEATN